MPKQVGLYIFLLFVTPRRPGGWKLWIFWGPCIITQVFGGSNNAKKYNIIFIYGNIEGVPS